MTTESPPTESGLVRKRWILLALLIIAAGGLGHFVYTRVTGEPKARPAYWEQRLLDLDPPPEKALKQEPTQLLSQWPFQKHPGFRALKLEHHKLHDLLQLDWDPDQAVIQVLSEIFRNPTYEKLRGELRDALDRGWPVAPELLSFVTRPIWDYQLWAVRSAIHGRWALHERQDVELMLEDWRMMLQLARQLQRPRTDPYYLSSSRIHVWVAYEMMRLHHLDGPSLDSKAWALKMDVLTGPRLPIETLTEGDRLQDQFLLESVYVSDGGWLSVKALAESYSTIFGGRNRNISRWWNLTSPLFHDRETALASHEAYYDELASRAVSLGATERLEAELRASHQPDIVPGILNGNMRWYYHGAPGLSAYRLHLISRCMLDAGLTMIALREYRRRHGTYPESLEDLLPSLLPRLPIDDADEARKPLRYRRIEDGRDYILYSVGINGIDDGGHQPEGWPPRFDERYPDVVFSAVDWRKVKR